MSFTVPTASTFHFKAPGPNTGPAPPPPNTGADKANGQSFLMSKALVTFRCPGSEADSDSDVENSREPDTSRPSSPTLTDLDIVRSGVYWFEDGNVVVEVDRTQFKLHLSVLRMNSGFFERKFNPPFKYKPPPAEVKSEPEPVPETVDGFPLVRLKGDKAQDFMFILEVLYHSLSAFKTTISLDQCAALIRLGTKYDMKGLREEGLRRFNNTFPSDLKKWQRHPNCSMGKDLDEEIQRNEIKVVEEDYNFYEQALGLANEFSQRRAIPAICLSLAKLANADKHILKSLCKAGPRDANLTNILSQTLSGRIDILRRIHDITCTWISKPSHASSFCTSNRPEYVLKALKMGRNSNSDNTFLTLKIIDRVFPVDEDPLFEMCYRCKVSFKGDIERFRKQLWEDLPSIFVGSTKTWGHLKNKD